MGRGRRSNSSKYFHFDANRFLADLKSELYHATVEAEKVVASLARQKASSLPFKDNEVKLADGTVTSDLERKGALIDSIVSRGVKYTASQMQNDLKSHAKKIGSNTTVLGTVTAMGDKGNYKNTHVGVYYEYGIGTKATPPPVGMSLGDPNPFRPAGAGSMIVSRSNGIWRDLGGNARRSRGSGGAKYSTNDKFRRYIGEETDAYHWFAEAARESRPKVISLFREAVRKVNYKKYITVNGFSNRK